jgi:kinesin family protein 18/19
VLTLQDLFERIQHIDNADYEYKVTFNYLEVYNENIRDLLSPSAAYLDLREDPIKGMCVAGISDWEVESASEIMELLKRGNKHRSQEPTKANVFSSRSHAVLQVRRPARVAKPHRRTKPPRRPTRMESRDEPGSGAPLVRIGE